MRLNTGYRSEWAYLKENMGFSEEFVREYQPGIVNFLLRGGSSMIRPLYNELQYRNESEKSCEALRRIVQAELMGQFYKLKYFAGDLKQKPLPNSRGAGRCLETESLFDQTGPYGERGG